MAFSVGAIEGTLELDRSPFQRGLRDARAEAERFERKPIKAVLDLNDRLGKAKAEQFRRILDKIDGRNVVADVNVRGVARQETELAVLQAQLRRLDGKRIRIDVDVRRGAIERTTAAVGFLNRALGGITGTVSQAVSGIPIIGQVLSATLGAATSAGTAAEEVVTKLVSSFSGLGTLAAPVGQLSGQIASFVVSLAGMALVAGGVIIALNAILQAAIALGGALVALVASAAAAAAGLGALGIAFAFALGPAVLVAIALFSRFQAVLQARKAREQELAGAVQAQKQAEQQRASALQQTQAAVQNLRTQTVAAYQAMRQSVEDLLHAENARENAALGRQGARLQLRQAQQDLKDFARQAGASGNEISRLFQRFANVDFTPGAARGLFSQTTGKDIRGDQLLQLQQRLFAVREAVQGVRNADLYYHDSLGQLNKAEQTRAEFVRKGITAYGPYRQAIDQVNRAKARELIATARTTAAQRKYEQALRKLSPTEQGTLSRLEKLIAGFGRFSKILTDPIFKAFNDVLDRLSGKAGVFEGALAQVGQAFAVVLRAFGTFLSEPRTLEAFQIMSRGAANLARQLGARAFIDFLRILREIAITALPFVERAARRVADALHSVAQQPARIHAATRTVVNQFRAWLGLAGAVARLVLNLFRAAAPAGRSLAVAMTQIVNRWSAWIKANPEKVREFFRNAVIRARQIVAGIRDAVTWLVKNLPPAAKTAADAFRVIARIVSGIYNSVRKTVDLLKGKFHLPGIGKLDLPGPLDVLKGPMIGPKLLKKFLFGAAGGLALGPHLGVIGEGGPEALIPLTPQVLAGIGRAQAAAMVRSPGPAAAGAGPLRTGPVHLGDQIFQIHGYVNEDKLLIKARREREREMRKWG